MLPISESAAELLAIEALTWLVSNEDLLPIFMGATGTSANDLKTRANDAEFQASVLDFILMDDKWVTGFCDHGSHAYDLPMRARAALPGGAAMNWT